MPTLLIAFLAGVSVGGWIVVALWWWAQRPPRQEPLRGGYLDFTQAAKGGTAYLYLPTEGTEHGAGNVTPAPPSLRLVSDSADPQEGRG